MLAEMLQRLFERNLDDAAQAKARNGEWLPELWAEIAEMGLPLALLSEEHGGFGLSPAEAGEALRMLGSYAVPLPVAETMAANRLFAAAGLPLAEGPAGILGSPDGRVAWAENLDCIAYAHEGRLYRVLCSSWAIAEPGHALTGHPRDTVKLDLTTAESAALPHDVLAEGATVRAFQIAGALEAALDLTLQHTGTRVQFGKPLSKFQAVQHELAKLAGELACATAAADLAAEALARGDMNGVAAGTLRAREAAGSGAAIATQMHGAIGFTREHRLHLFTTALWTWRDDFGGQVHWARILGQSGLDAGPQGFWPMVTAL